MSAAFDALSREPDAVDCLVAAPDVCAGDLRQSLVGRQLGYAIEVAVVADHRFLGVVPIERLLT